MNLGPLVEHGLRHPRQGLAQDLRPAAGPGRVLAQGAPPMARARLAGASLEAAVQACVDSGYGQDFDGGFLNYSG